MEEAGSKPKVTYGFIFLGITMSIFMLFVACLLLFVSGYNFCEYINIEVNERKLSQLLIIIVDIVLAIYVMISLIGHFK